MDDFLSGADTIEKTKQIYKDVSQILQKGGLLLRKWSSNEVTMFEDFKVENASNTHQFSKEASQKTLGVIWKPSTDTLTYLVKVEKHNVTKRTILAITAQIFDPLGLLGPITIIAKIIIQKLCQYKLS